MVINEYSDARCQLDTAEGVRVRFSLREGRKYRRKFGAPSNGFVRIACTSDKGPIETPGNFHLEDGGLAEVRLEPWGEAKVHYVRREEFGRVQ